MADASAHEQRISALAAKFAAGEDLTDRQLDELRGTRPDLFPAPFVLESPPARTAKLTKAEEEKFSALYKKGWRQLRRWVEKGEKAGDPCPLHDPVALMSWWPRHNTWRVPPEVEEAAAAARRSQETASVSPTASSASVVAPPVLPAPETPGAGKRINLEDFDPEEGDRLRELKQLQSAKFAQLNDALELGHDTALLEGKYVKLCETIDKIETRVTERLKKRGLFILRAEVERDLAAAAELLRQSKTSFKRRVLEQCPSLNAEQRDEVARGIDSASAAEERILSRLDSLTADDLLRDLAA